MRYASQTAQVSETNLIALKYSTLSGGVLSPEA
jgi:hypothetical protein